MIKRSHLNYIYCSLLFFLFFYQLQIQINSKKNAQKVFLVFLLSSLPLIKVFCLFAAILYYINADYKELTSDSYSMIRG